MRILFVCSGGMSSAIVVKALQDEAKKKGQDVEVLAVGTQEFADKVTEGWDISMVAPQVKHRFKSFKESSDAAGVPCIAIPPQAYSPLGGPVLFKLLNENLSS